jgi:transposase
MPVTGGCTSSGAAFLERKKNPLVANVAIARQLAGWCWSLSTLN